MILKKKTNIYVLIIKQKERERKRIERKKCETPKNEIERNRDWRRERGERESKINNSSKIAERCTFSRNGETEMSISTRVFHCKKIAMKLFHIKLVPFDPCISDMWVSMVDSVEWQKQRGNEGWKRRMGRRMEERCDGKSNYAEYET